MTTTTAGFRLGPVPGRFARLRAATGGWLGIAATLVLVALVGLAVLGPLVERYDPADVNLSEALAHMSTRHWLGTDENGRDTWARLIHGARLSLIGPLAVVLVSTVLGTLLGLLAGWCGKTVDAVLGRVFDILFAFPGLLLGILAVAVFGKGLLAPIIAMSIAYVPYTARLVRELVRTAKSRPYVSAYEVQGFGSAHIAVRKVLPNILPTVLAQSSVNFGYALLDLAALSFLGLGVQPPAADWGTMINDSRGAVLLGEPLSAVVPSLAVIVSVVAFNVLGEELADRIGTRTP